MLETYDVLYTKSFVALEPLLRCGPLPACGTHFVTEMKKYPINAHA